MYKERRYACTSLALHQRVESVASLPPWLIAMYSDTVRASVSSLYRAPYTTLTIIVYMLYVIFIFYRDKDGVQAGLGWHFLLLIDYTRALFISIHSLCCSLFHCCFLFFFSILWSMLSSVFFTQLLVTRTTCVKKSL